MRTDQVQVGGTYYTQVREPLKPPGEWLKVKVICMRRGERLTAWHVSTDGGATIFSRYAEDLHLEPTK